MLSTTLRRLAVGTCAVITIFVFATATCGQTNNMCSETSGVYHFQRLGERVVLPVQEADCEAVSLELHWANGRNNGSNFNISFLDTANRVIYSKQLFGFMTGNAEVPFSSFYSAPFFGSRALISVPATITIQTVSPFARPASLSYRITRVARPSRANEPKLNHEKESLVQRDEGLVRAAGMD